ncbi:chromosome segregation protein SMC [Streptococcus catagoni]|uniref:chromosome segregation protein SMC n=1 Tax=Streptococcus catagoni TaxID=2654874 RepID=UPI001407DE3B|nr:chromosome segregation protein SMC [Streptococcus catagoni]
MFLKKIEMQGFKSFADKTKIEFDKGVTAVVGPNGSGKSNVTESLRWALGESSAKSLRGGKMPDIIFSGTESRNALNFAEVAITLDNSDGFIKGAQKEIRVERHIYRNGDSDYLIDGKKVRLRDIHELFLDTGLGRDSFSIISQGRVEEIFNSKPEERRAIFEEAAGVLKYKTRKKETQSKLNQTQDNLDRLEDIIYELETQVKPLEKQAKIAKEFLLLDDQRKQLQIDILVEDVKHNKDLQSQKAEALEALEADLKNYYATRDRLEEENQQLKQKRQRIAAEIDHKQADLLELTKLLSNLERQIDLIKLESNQKNEKKLEADTRIAELQSQLSHYQEELQQKKSALELLEADLVDLSAKSKATEQELQRFSDDPDQLIEHLREDFVRLMQNEAELSNQLTALLSDIEKESQAKEDLALEYQEIKIKVDHLKAENDQNSAELEAKEAQLQDLLKSYQSLEREIQEDEVIYQQAQSQLFDILDQKKAKEARRASLESIQKNHSQFYAGVRSVLQNAKGIGGILGAVSEHLSFEKEYQLALEIALGASSQNIIVENEAAAKRAIEYLKKNRQGRATFLPLTTIKARQLNDSHQKLAEKCQGFIGTAESLVTYEEKLGNIFKNLLTTTLIFDSLDHANQAAKKLQYKVRIITLDGTELRPGGSFSGGANRQNNTTFIKPELDQITSDIEKLNKHLKEKEKSVAALQENLKSSKEELETLKRKGETARFEEQKARFNYQLTQDSLNDSEKVLKAIEENQSEEESQLYREEQETLEKNLQTISLKKEALSKEIDEIKNNKELINEKKASLSEDLAQLRLKERDLLSEKRFEKSNCDRLSSDINQTSQNIAKLQELIDNQLSEEDISKLPDLEKQQGEIREAKEKVEQRLVQLRFESEDNQALLEELESKLLLEQEKNENFIRKQTKLESEIEQLSDLLITYARSLSEDFQLTFEEAALMANSLENIQLAKNDLKTIQKSIKALGPINSDAIEQYEEVAERLAFLSHQKADLSKAKNLLLDTIGQMDSEVKARFKVTFEAIRESFKETFKQMFGGGSADLLLTDGDLLLAGVDIAVQPPGKKIQSLNLMSGGEKALSALALLFAIIRVKTIPFVILDEVEAALDEANVKRFGDYLNRFDKDSQFIVVTHRKGTMAAADSIYGITMQESGVSKVVSVKLKDSKNLTFLA